MTLGQLTHEACSLLGAKIVGSLRDGGQKVVKLVEKDGHKYVLKIVSFEPSQPEALKRAHREVELLKSIDNSCVVKVASDLVELGRPISGAAWLEEYLAGKDLSDLLGPEWDWSSINTMALDVSYGLSALHDADVVHRDLSPGNVRLTDQGDYVVLDPGFAKHTLRSGITIGGQPGTPGFMSPEHLNVFSGTPNPSSDIFQLGILMYSAATGKIPIPYLGDDADYFARLRKVELVDLSILRPDLPRDGIKIIERCLHRQPARRFRNGTRLQEALEG